MPIASVKVMPRECAHKLLAKQRATTTLVWQSMPGRGLCALFVDTVTIESGITTKLWSITLRTMRKPMRVIQASLLRELNNLQEEAEAEAMVVAEAAKEIGGTKEQERALVTIVMM